MNLNLKQKELIEYLFNKVKEKYPEIELIGLSTSPDDPNHVWINVNADMDEDRQIEMSLFTADIEADIHIDYGYRISIMLENTHTVYA